MAADNVKYITPENFTAENFNLTPVKKINGKTMFYVNYENTACAFLSPEVQTLYGVSCYDKGGAAPEELNYSMVITPVSKTREGQELVDRYFEQFRALDNMMIEHAVKNATAMFGKSRNRTQIEAIYTPCVRQKDEGSPFMINCKIGRDKNDKSHPNVKLFQGTSRTETPVTGFDQLKATVRSRSFVRICLKPRVYIVPSGKFGISLDVTHIKTESQAAARASAYVFGGDDQDETAEEETGEASGEAAEETVEEEGGASAEAVDSDAE
jgi:hypothetical protein